MPLFTTSGTINAVLLFGRVAFGLMILAHGYAKIFRGGKLAGTAGWFDAIGMRPGALHARMAAGTEIGVGLLLALGLLTPLAAAGLVSVMTVAIVTVHRKNGFFIYNEGQGIEYCAMIIVSAIVLGTVGPGKYSLDHLIFPRDTGFWHKPVHAGLTVVVVGFGAALLQLVAFYRPAKNA